MRTNVREMAEQYFDMMMSLNFKSGLSQNVVVASSALMRSSSLRGCLNILCSSPISCNFCWIYITFLTELEVLREMCEEDIIVNDKPNASEVCITLHPATAGNKDAQYVCLTLIIIITPEYPDIPARFHFRNPRGMSEDELERITQDLNKLAEEKRGCEMMYDLIQAAKDSLTENNSPSLPCTICQYQFEDSDVFTKTTCYHYFHSFCLRKYLQFTEENEEEEPKCPVCREPLQDTLLKNLQDAPEPSLDDCPDIEVSPETRQWQEKMRVEFERQKAKGGHIDIEAENNKHLISIRHVPTTSFEELVSQQLKSATLAATDAKVTPNQSKQAAEHNHRKHKDGAPVFVHNKHHNRHGGRGGTHGGSRGRGEGRGHHKSQAKHSGWRDERPGSSRGHQKRDHQRWTGDRDRQMERRGKDGQKKGERKEEADKSIVQSEPARDKEMGESTAGRVDNEKGVKQENEKKSDMESGECIERKGGELEPSAIAMKEVETKEVKKDNGEDVEVKDEVKKSEKKEEEMEKSNDGKIKQERPDTGRSTQGRQNDRYGGRDMKGIKNREHRDKYHHTNDMKQHDRDQQHINRKPARSNHSDVVSRRNGPHERHEDMKPNLKNNEREERRGGSGEGGGRRGGRGGYRGGRSGRGGTGRGGHREGISRDKTAESCKGEKTGESSLKGGNSSERAEKSNIRPPPGFDQHPKPTAQTCKPPPGFDFR